MDLISVSDIVIRKFADVTADELLNAVEPAINKLQRIISRQGDSDGKRLTTQYIAALICEEIGQARFSAECQEKYKKRCAAEATHLNHINIILCESKNVKEVYL